ncbi:MAG: glycosyltransferase [Anaerolineae bacterium]|nr:MAG: glycosyltransferase [Anaerolineae bacterium]
MHILYLVPYVPSPIYVRPYQILRTLARRGHRVTLLTLLRHPDEQSALDALQESGIQIQALTLPPWRTFWNMLGALSDGSPLQARYAHQPHLYRLLKSICQPQDEQFPFDVIHVEHLRGVQYALYLERLCPAIPIIWDSVDCISYLFGQAAAHSRSFFGQWVTRLELGRTMRYERSLLQHFDCILVTSQKDRQAYEQLLKPGEAHTPLDILPNGVSLDDFYPAPQSERSTRTLVVSGKMSYHANITMVRNLVEDIMPLVWRIHPEVHLQIVGKDPPPVIQSLQADKRIEVTGTVPHVRPYLQRGTIAVAPLAYGAGIQNKVLEAMACATPVVCTPQAIAALDVEPGRHLLVGDTPENFARAVCTLLENPQQRERIGLAGHAYVEAYHRWDAIVARLEGIYQRAQIARIKAY